MFETKISGFFVSLILAAGVVSGCSTVKPYPNTLEKNVHIWEETDSGSFFTDLEVAVDIFSVASDCRETYEGTVYLEDGPIDVGIPVNKKSYLKFFYLKSGLFGQNKGKVSHGSLLKAREGHRYDIKLTYDTDIYNAEILEIFPGRSENRKIDLREFAHCKPENQMTEK